MERTIIIRYGEIFLKGNNRYIFENRLIANIKSALKGLDFQFRKTQARYFIDNYQPSDETEIIERLKKVCGIHSISPAVKLKTDIEEIKKVALDMSPDKGLFRVTVRRADKSIQLSSMQIQAEIGGYILENRPNLKVDLFKYDFDIEVDMRENGFSYVFSEKIACQNGMPVGTSANGMLLLSGGIDSPVAGYLMAKRGMRIYAVHFHSYPYTSLNAKEKVLELAGIISDYAGSIEVSVVPFTEIQYAIHEHCPKEYMITIMRRFMMKVAEKLAVKKHCAAIITGESLGQVASQTAESINVTNSVVKLPVFRPLIGTDKEEIVKIAKNIGTFETSILPYEDCCTVFLPKNPVIHPDINLIEKAEARIPNADELIEKAIAEIEVVTKGRF